jgi:hypothetical protein
MIRIMIEDMAKNIYLLLKEAVWNLYKKLHKIYPI